METMERATELTGEDLVRTAFSKYPWITEEKFKEGADLEKDLSLDFFSQVFPTMETIATENGLEEFEIRELHKLKTVGDCIALVNRFLPNEKSA
jgi:hypothetical protein